MKTQRYHVGLVIFVALLLAGCSAPAEPPTPPSLEHPDHPVIHPAWSGEVIQTLVIEYDFSFPEKVWDERPEDFIPAITAYIMPRLGMRVVESPAEADAVLRVRLTGEPISAVYVGGGTCYEGAHLTGELALHSQTSDAAVTVPIDVEFAPPETVSGCNDYPGIQVFTAAPGAYLTGLAALWDAETLVAYGWGIEQRWFYLIDGPLTVNVLPELLVILTSDGAQQDYPYPVDRLEVIEGIGARIESMGPEAAPAVPYLLAALADVRDSDGAKYAIEDATESIHAALAAITGETFTENADWWRWWAGQNA